LCNESDSGYFSSDKIQYYHEQSLDAYLPEGTGEGGVSQWQGDLIRGRDCRMEIRDIKRLTCLGGQVMETLVAKKDRGNYFYRFHSDASKCEGCEFSARCYPEQRHLPGLQDKEGIFETLSLRARMTVKLSSEQGKKTDEGQVLPDRGRVR